MLIFCTPQLTNFMTTQASQIQFSGVCHHLKVNADNQDVFTQRIPGKRRHAWFMLCMLVTPSQVHMRNITHQVHNAIAFA